MIPALCRVSTAVNRSRLVVKPKEQWLPFFLRSDRMMQISGRSSGAHRECKASQVLVSQARTHLRPRWKNETGARADCSIKVISKPSDG